MYQNWKTVFDHISKNQEVRWKYSGHDFLCLNTMKSLIKMSLRMLFPALFKIPKDAQEFDQLDHLIKQCRWGVEFGTTESKSN